MTPSPHWNRFEIHRFRGLRRLSLEDLGMFNVLVGANDTGKSSVLESMFLLAGSGNMELPIRVQEARGHDVRGMTDLLYLFHDLDSAAGIRLLAETDTPPSSRELSIAVSRDGPDPGLPSHPGDNSRDPRSRAVLSSSDDSEAHHASLHYDVRMSSQPAPTRISSGSLSFRNGRPVATTEATLHDTTVLARFLNEGFAQSSTAVGDVLVKKREHVLIRYLQSVNPRVTNVVVRGARAYLDIGLSERLPITSFGSGMVRACSMLAYAVLGGIRFLLVEEIGAGLHYNAMAPLLRGVIRFAVENGVQVVATTHNLDVLQRLREVLGRDDMIAVRDVVACYALQRNPDGHVRAYRYGYDNLDHSIGHGIEIR